MANATTDAVDTGQEDSIDTSSTEEVQDTEALDPDDPNLGDDWDDDVQDVDQDDETEESDDSTEEEAATDSEEEDLEDSDEDVESDDSKTEASDAEAAEKAARDEQLTNTEAAQRRMADREQKRVETKKAEQQAYLDEATNAEDLRIRRNEVDTYNNRVMLVENTLHSNINNLVASPGLTELFHHKDPDIREEMLEAVADYDRLYVKRDKNGDPLEDTGDMQQFLQKRATRIQRLTGIGAKRQQQDKSNQRKRVTTVPKRSPAKTKSDPMLDGFDEEVESWKG
jgi:hypothetical protein